MWVLTQFAIYYSAYYSLSLTLHNKLPLWGPQHACSCLHAVLTWATSMGYIICTMENCSIRFIRIMQNPFLVPVFHFWSKELAVAAGRELHLWQNKRGSTAQKLFPTPQAAKTNVWSQHRHFNQTSQSGLCAPFPGLVLFALQSSRIIPCIRWP